MQDCVLIDELVTADSRRFGHATLNFGAKLNALSLGMIDRLGPVLSKWAEDDSVIGVVLDSVGDRAFCAGGELQLLYASMRETPEGQIPQQAARFFEREYRLNYQIHTYPKQILCWGHGIKDICQGLSDLGGTVLCPLASGCFTYQWPTFCDLSITYRSPVHAAEILPKVFEH